MRFVLNVLWLVLAGFWLALGVQAFKLAGYALWPFGKEVVRIRDLRRVPPGAIAVRR